MINTPETIYKSLKKELKDIVVKSNEKLYKADLKVSNEKEGLKLLDKLFGKPVEHSVDVVADSLNQIDSCLIQDGVLKSYNLKKYTGIDLFMDYVMPNYSSFQVSSILVGATHPDNLKKMMNNPNILNGLRNDKRYRNSSSKEREGLLISLCVLLICNNFSENRYLEKMADEMEQLFLIKCEERVNYLK